MESASRHPLGLPPGSVRSLLMVMIVGLFIALIALPATQPVTMPAFLYLLLPLLLVYLVAHGRLTTDDETRPPLHLPKGAIPVLVTVALVAVIAWKYTIDRNALMARLQPSADQLQNWPYLLAALIGGFLVGRLLSMGPWKHTAMFKDLLAWLSLLCMLGLGIETLAVIFVHPSLPEGLNLHKLEAGLTAAVALYFGARS